MTKHSKLNIVYLLQKWMDSVAGQTFLNYAYSWGAAVVILGTLFKLTHIPGANAMLFIGMGTEVFVFFISAFDRPLKKTTDSEKETLIRNVAFDLENENQARRVSEIQETDDSETCNKVFNSIGDAYKKHLMKLNSQLENMEEMDEQLKIQASYISELNKIYGRMLDAVKVKE